MYTSGHLIYCLLFELSQLLCAERKTDKSEYLVNRNPVENNGYPANTPRCFCVCVNTYLLLYQSCLWSSANPREAGGKKRDEQKGRREIRMKGKRLLLRPLSLLLYVVYQNEKEVSSWWVDRENMEGCCWRGVGTEWRTAGIVREMCWGSLWHCSCFECVHLCVWMDPVLSFQEKGGAIRGVDRKL